MPSRFLVISLAFALTAGFFSHLYTTKGGFNLKADINNNDDIAAQDISMQIESTYNYTPGDSTPTPTKEPTSSPLITPTPSLFPEPTLSPNITPSPTSSLEPTPNPSPISSPSPTSSLEPTPNPSPISSPSPSAIPSTPPQSTPRPGSTPIPTPSSNPTASPSEKTPPSATFIPQITPRPSPAPNDCRTGGFFSWLSRIIGYPNRCGNRKNPLPSPSPTPTPTPTTAPTDCPPIFRLISFGLFCGAPKASPSPTPTASASPKSASPSPKTGNNNDKIRFIIDLDNANQNIYHNRDFETTDPVLHRAWLYSYINKNDPAVISIIAKSKIKQAGDSTWYIDFTAADFGSTNFIPTNTYCVELGFRFIRDSLTYKQAYRANQYIVYSDTTAYDSRVGTFHHTANSGLTQAIGRGFLESTGQKKIFCPTILPRR